MRRHPLRPWALVLVVALTPALVCACDDDDGEDREDVVTDTTPPDTAEDVQDTAEDVQDTADDVQDTADDVQDTADDVRDTADDVQDTAEDVQDTGDVADVADMVAPELAPLALELVAEGNMTSPLALAQPDDGTGRRFIVDQTGPIFVLQADGTLQSTPWADLSDRIVDLLPEYDERGVLGLAFHPDFATNGRLFIYYSAPLRASAPAGFDHTNTLSEFTVDANGDFDPTSERKLLEIDHPQFNHNGGTVAFGPDGFLYLSLGDGGGANDVGLGHTEGLGNAQDITKIHGSVLRIDVDTGDPYGIPPSNPFAGDTPGADEIFAYGLRNPYRFSFDTPTGRLILGDAGQDLMEEVDLIELGNNYGWNIKEGTLCFDPDNPTMPPETCPDQGPNGEPLVAPILTFTRPESAFEDPSQDILDILASSEVHGLVVVGGYIYRGTALPDYDGHYIFGTFSASKATPAGHVFVGVEDESGAWSIATPTIEGDPDGNIGEFILSFGQDLSGELYVLTTNNLGPSGTTGQVYRIVPAP